MGRIYDLDRAYSEHSPQLRDWCYNALDCTGTREIADVIIPRLNRKQRRIYGFEKALQAPALAMQQRGVLVNEQALKATLRTLKREIVAKKKVIDHDPILQEKWDGMEKETGYCLKSTRKDNRHTWEKGVPDSPERKCVSCGCSRFRRKPFNANSPDQIKHLFYDILRVPVIKNKQKKVSADKEAIMKIGQRKPHLKPLTDKIAEVKDIAKQIGFLSARRSPDGRYKSTFSVGAAWTGRFSSTKDPFGYGGNLQNIAEKHRHLFIADPGFDIGYADLEQAESNAVAHIAGDEDYIKAHLSGDVHTYATRLIWPDELPWTGDLKKDKEIAKANPPWDTAPGHNYRFQAKRIQHGSNYGLSPRGISMIAHIPFAAAKQAYDAYHSAFPHIREWHRVMADRISNMEFLENPVGRVVQLFGRPWDGHTLKQGLAFPPQSLVADLIGIALWRVWHDLEPTGEVRLLAQVHDALLFLSREGNMDIVRQVVEYMTIPVDVTDIYGVTRTMTIGVEAALGKNWGKRSKSNPNGIKEIHL